MTPDIDPALVQQLVVAAAKARLRAYAPYSNYQVGAALLAEDGTIYVGCNIENAAYGPTVCAERVAVFKAVSEGTQRFTAVAVVTRDGGAPCGVCRQVLNEFGPEMLVIVADAEGRVQFTLPLSDLLPRAFGPQNLA